MGKTHKIYQSFNLNLYSFRPLHPLREESTVEARSRSFFGTILSEREKTNETEKIDLCLHSRKAAFFRAV
jgi:hypothetical protein